jgi:glycosyltransferase involved in cell wall biosynthesis
MMQIYAMHTTYNVILDNLRFARRAFVTLRRIGHTQPIDVLHCLYPHSSLLAAVMYKWLVSRRVKIIYDVRSPWIRMSLANHHVRQWKRMFVGIMHGVEYLLVRMIDQIVYITQWLADRYQQTYHLPVTIPVSCIPTGVDVAFWQQARDDATVSHIKEELAIPPDRLVIGYIGTISRMRKMDDFFVQQQQTLIWSKVVFVLIGDGDGVQELEQVVATHHLQKHVRLLGKQPQHTLMPYMHVFDRGRCHLPDIFVFRQSFPLKILEYLAAGVPILCSKIVAHITLAQEFPSHIQIYDHHIPFATLQRIPHRQPANIMQYDWSVLVARYHRIYADLISS